MQKCEVRGCIDGQTVCTNHLCKVRKFIVYGLVKRFAQIQKKLAQAKQITQTHSAALPFKILKKMARLEIRCFLYSFSR